MNKYQYMEQIKQLLQNENCQLENEKEINYGLQIEVSRGDYRGILRVYQGKKGVRLDTSQIREIDLKLFIEKVLQHTHTLPNNKSNSYISQAAEGEVRNIEDPIQIIGIDESGKGDFFGPLVIAGVYTDEKTDKILRALGVRDSKNLSDTKIKELSVNIRQLCPYNIVTLGNERYNELYDEIGNLNKILAWGHARVLENMLELIECNYALSDQFGKSELIEKALMEKGRKIHLEQRPRAEQNIAVAAASILARDGFITNIADLETQFDMKFPKGASSMVTDAAKIFSQRYGTKELFRVAKTHFKIAVELSNDTKL